MEGGSEERMRLTEEGVVLTREPLAVITASAAFLVSIPFLTCLNQYVNAS